MHLAVYLLFIAVAYPLSLLPFRVLYVMSDILSFLLEHVFRYRRNIIRVNLCNAFPEKKGDEINQVIHNFYKNLSDVIVENIKLISLNSKEVMKRCLFENLELLEEYKQQGKSVVAAVAHYNNWEFGGLSLALNAPYNIMAVYKPSKNAYFNRFSEQMRGRFGTQAVPMKSIGREMLKNKDGQTLAVFITDQTPSNTFTAHWKTFLNQDTPVFTGLERLARKLNAAVVFCYLKRKKRGYYSVELIEITGEAAETTDNEITEAHTKVLEKIICENPSNWLWSHKRWKHDRPVELREPSVTSASKPDS